MDESKHRKCEVNGVLTSVKYFGLVSVRNQAMAFGDVFLLTTGKASSVGLQQKNVLVPIMLTVNSYNGDNFLPLKLM